MLLQREKQIKLKKEMEEFRRANSIQSPNISSPSERIFYISDSELNLFDSVPKSDSLNNYQPKNISSSKAYVSFCII